MMVNDLLAASGTMSVSCRMVEELGGNIVGIAFLVELDFLNGRGENFLIFTACVNPLSIRKS